MSHDREALDGLRIDRSAATKRIVSPWLLVILLLLLAIGGGAFWFIKRTKAAVVRTIVVQEQSTGGGGQRTLLNGSGYVTARRQATVSSKVTGKVLEVLVEEGMKVEPGQVLARLDSVNVEAGLRLSEAQRESARHALKETRANLDQAQREFERLKQLATNNIASASDLDRAEALAKSLHARIEYQDAQVVVGEREVAQWKQQLDDTVIRAPFAGIVTVKNAQPGEMISPVSAGSGFTRTGICTLVDMNSLEIEVDVNESFINRVEPGQRVVATLDSYADWQIPSKVIAIIPAADRQKATVKVRVGFDKLDKRILPDMGVKVAFQGNDTEAPSTARNVTIPKASVREDNGKSVVWVVRDGRTERRAITVAVRGNDEVTVAAGLSGGERVVVEGADGLVEGARVTETKR